MTDMLDEIRAIVADHPQAEAFIVQPVPTIDAIAIGCPAKGMTVTLMRQTMEAGGWQSDLRKQLDAMAKAPVPDDPVLRSLQANPPVPLPEPKPAEPEP